VAINRFGARIEDDSGLTELTENCCILEEVGGIREFHLLLRRYSAVSNLSNKNIFIVI
jgi:hypothetical protein